MNLPKDCVIKICLEMDLPTLNKFLLTSKEKFEFIDVFFYRYYKEGSYKYDCELYKKKQKILTLIENTERVEGKILVLRKDDLNHRIENRYPSKLIRNNFKYVPEHRIYVNDCNFDVIITTIDPNIKLEELRQLIYG